MKDYRSVTELLHVLATLFFLLTLTDSGLPFANFALQTLRPGPQPPSPEMKPNGQVTWAKKEKQVDPKALWESERNTSLRASEGLYLP